jgi:hypothetical protein
MLYRYYILYALYIYIYRLQSYTEDYDVDINISVCYTDITYCILYIGID